jgi:hypothetical protein
MYCSGQDKTFIGSYIKTTTQETEDGSYVKVELKGSDGKIISFLEATETFMADASKKKELTGTGASFGDITNKNNVGKSFSVNYFISEAGPNVIKTVNQQGSTSNLQVSLTATERTYLYPIYQKGKFGYINNYGQIVVATKYDYAEEGAEGMYQVGIKVNGVMNYLFLDSDGNELSERYSNVTSYKDGIARVHVNSTYNFIDKKGKVLFKIEDGKELIIDQPINSKPSNELIKFQALPPYSNPRLFGFLNKKGEIVIPAKYTDIGEFHEGMCKVYINGSYGFMDTTGKIVIAPKYKKVGDFINGVSRTPLGYIDKTGVEIISTNELGAGDFYNGFAITYPTDYVRGYGFINRAGKKIIKSTDELYFENAKNFAENRLAPVQIDGKWAFINAKGEIVIDPIFDQANSFVGNLAKVEITNGVLTKSGAYIIGRGYIDKTGKFISFEEFTTTKKCFE